MPYLVEFHEQFADQGVHIISIDRGQRHSGMSELLEQYGVRHTVLNDASGDVGRDYRVTGVPTTVLIDHEGRAVFRHVGFAHEYADRFRNEIEALVAWRDAAALES